MRIQTTDPGLPCWRAATLAALLVFLPASAARSAAFSDITDPDVAEAAEVLRLLGVVDGTGGGAFNPGGTLTRAEFCKMAIEIMGKGGEEPAQRNRTIFPDVGPSHWASGYVNLASTPPPGWPRRRGAAMARPALSWAWATVPSAPTRPSPTARR